MKLEPSAEKSKAHQIYRLKDGSRVPGTTTITGILDKPALKFWANNLGLAGISVKDYVDDLAVIGKLAHLMVENYIKKVETDFSDYSPNQRERAENSFSKFLVWEKENKFDPLESELMMVSEEYQFGGQIDIYANLNGKPTLIDIKTSKACYSEHYTQVVAYRQLLIENGRLVDDVRILRIGRDETEGFENIKVPAIDLHWERFRHCLAIYKINKKLKKGG